MAAKNPTVPAALPQPSPTFEFSIRQRAGLQLLGDALQYLGSYGEADREAAQILWRARERVLKAAERRSTKPPPRRQLAIVWRNPKAVRHA